MARLKPVARTIVMPEWSMIIAIPTIDTIPRLEGMALRTVLRMISGASSNPKLPLNRKRRYAKSDV